MEAAVVVEFGGSCTGIILRGRQRVTPCYAILADSLEDWGAEKKVCGFEEVEGLGGCGQG